METALAENLHLGTDAGVAENSHLGFRVVFAGMHPAIDEVKSNIASGIGDEVRREGIRSRSTGKERDPETGLDFFGPRYLSGAQGRFLSPDQPLIDQNPADPQSWNLYSYVRNNPLKFTDPTGTTCVYNDDDSGHQNPVGDNGDGQGCEKAGVKPSTQEQRDNGTDLAIGKPSATAYTGEGAVAAEVSEILGMFATNGPKAIEYPPQDPFTQDFQKSAGMDAIVSAVKQNCRATTGGVAVRTGEAFINTLIDGILGGQGFYTPEAQLGAFVAAYTRQEGGTLNVTVTNDVSVNSAVYHLVGNNRIGNKQGGAFGTAKQTLHVAANDPCR